jgi:2-C-methyl-D-erythritol 4-phosphate cytidylyltransferase
MGERRHAGVVLAAGEGSRVGASSNKVYLPLAGRRVLTWSLETLRQVPGVERLLLVVRPADRELAAEVLGRELPGVAVELVAGGATRHQSEYRALHHLAGEIRAGRLEMVLVHDAARPLASAALAERVLAAARRSGAAVPGVAVDGLHGVDDAGRLAGPVTDPLVAVQTPQAFRAGPLLAAHEAAARDGFAGTDTAACVERYAQLGVRLVPGDPGNLKLTFPEDLLVAERLLAAAGRAPARAGARR